MGEGLLLDIENECEPIGYAVNPQFAITCPFLCDNDAERMARIGAEATDFSSTGWGTTAFFGEHDAGEDGHLE